VRQLALQWTGRWPWAASSIEEAAARSESEATWVGAGQAVAIAVANHG
jgi:hypothetical protein